MDIVSGGRDGGRKKNKYFFCMQVIKKTRCILVLYYDTMFSFHIFLKALLIKLNQNNFVFTNCCVILSLYEERKKKKFCLNALSRTLDPLGNH